MKRQLLASFVLSVLATSAFALPAHDHAPVHAKADTAEFSQFLTRSGSQDENNRDYAKGLAENGSEQANKRAYTEGGRDRLEQKGLVEGGSDRANSRVYAGAVAEGGADRLQELRQAAS